LLLPLPPLPPYNYWLSELPFSESVKTGLGGGLGGLVKKHTPLV
ncbi:unnamed protein product, partial [marine sediment metagenome]